MEQINYIFTQPRFKNYCLAVTKGSDLSEDLLQHCAIRIFEKGIQFKHDGHLYSYFKKIAFNEWITKGSEFNLVHKSKINDKFDLTEVFKKHMPTPETEHHDFREWLMKKLEGEELDERQWFLKEIFKTYLKSNDMRTMSKQIGIKFHVIQSAVKIYKTQLENDYHNAKSK